MMNAQVPYTLGHLLPDTQRLLAGQARCKGHQAAAGDSRGDIAGAAQATEMTCATRRMAESPAARPKVLL